MVDYGWSRVDHPIPIIKRPLYMYVQQFRNVSFRKSASLLSSTLAGHEWELESVIRSQWLQAKAWPCGSTTSTLSAINRTVRNDFLLPIFNFSIENHRVLYIRLCQFCCASRLGAMVQHNLDQRSREQIKKRGENITTKYSVLHRTKQAKWRPLVCLPNTQRAPPRTTHSLWPLETPFPAVVPAPPAVTKTSGGKHATTTT